MPYRSTELDLLRRRDPDKWREVIRQVLVREQGSVRRACRWFGVTRRHMYRIVARADLWDVIHDARRKGPGIPGGNPNWKRHRLPPDDDSGKLAVSEDDDWIARTRKALQ